MFSSFQHLPKQHRKDIQKSSLPWCDHLPGGVPIFSLYCQQLLELMIDVRRASKYTGRYGNSGEKKNGSPGNVKSRKWRPGRALKGFLLGLSNTRGAQKTQNAHLEEQNRGESKIGSSWRGVNTSTATVTTNTKSGPSSMGASSVRALKASYAVVRIRPGRFTFCLS